ncbi:MAG: hypothetical protein QOD93_4370, partial [Acetobacteraceae bacterium]|nr:hypothetical protein [Acetobacteraceae bacterium]
SSAIDVEREDQLRKQTPVYAEAFGGLA